MVFLVHFIDAATHVVAQVIKAQFIVGGIGDVRPIGGGFLGLGLLGVYNARGHTQCGIDL